jgi:tetratricopeptide (TPR) repeat protein
MARCKVNIVFVMVSVVAMPGIAVGMMLLHRWQLIRMSESLLTLARQEEEQERWPQAAEVLERIIRIQPRDAQVQSQLALDYARGARTLEDYQRGIELCYRALAHEQPFQESEVRCRLAELLLESNRLLEAEEEANKILQNQPRSRLANRVKALARFTQFQSGALPESINRGENLLLVVERARKLNPKDVTLTEIAATIYRSHPELVKPELPTAGDEERIQRADACLDALVENSHTDPAAYLARFQYRSRYNRTEAGDDLRKALEIAPLAQNVLRAAAQTALREAEELRLHGSDEQAAEMYSKACDYYRTIIARGMATGDVEPYLELGDSLKGLNASEEALDTWRRGLQLFSRPAIQIHLHARIADCLIEQGKLEEADKSLDDIKNNLTKLGASVTNIQRANLQRSQQLRRGTWHLLKREPLQAVPLLQQAIALEAKGPQEGIITTLAWKQLGQAYGMMEEWDQAAVAYDRAGAISPQDAPARLAAADAWLRAGRPELAVDRAEMAVSIHASFDAWLLLAVAHYRLQTLRSVEERSWKRFEEALETLELPTLVNDQSWRVILLKAEYASLPSNERGNAASELQEVAELIRQGAEKCPDVGDFWIRSIILLENVGLHAEADRALAKMKALAPTAPQIAIATARLASLRKNHPFARQTLEQAITSSDRGDQKALKRELWQAVETSGDLELLHSLLAAELTRHPHDICLLKRLAACALKRNDLAQLSQWERQLAQAGPTGEFWSQYFRAWKSLKVAPSPSDESLRVALDEQGKLVANRPTMARLLVLRGAIEHRLRHLNEAEAAYEQAIQIGALNKQVSERLSRIQMELGRTTETGQYLPLNQQRQATEQ